MKRPHPQSISRRLPPASCEQGVALLMVIIVLGAIAIGGVAAVSFSSSSARTADYGASESEARALADAGLSEAMSILNNPGSNLTDPNLLPNTSTTHATGETTWGGAFDSVNSVWALTSTGGSTNPTGGDDARHSASAKVWVADTVFTSNRPMGDGTTDREIWVMNLDGTGPYPLTDNNWEDGDAFWSPDTGTFVFETERDTDAATGAGKSNAGGPSTTNREIYSMRVDGSNLTRLTNAPGVANKKSSSADEDPQWGPNGRIAFDSLRNGHNDWAAGDPKTLNNWDVYLMEVDGSNPQNLTECVLSPSAGYWTKPNTGPGPSTVCSSDAEPAFGATNIMCLQSNAQTGNTALHGLPFTINPDGSITTGVPYILVNSSGKDRECDWSADGTLLLYMSDRDGDYEIFVMDITTGIETQLTFNTLNDEHPGFTPDNRIVFNSTRITGAVNINNPDGGEEMFIMNVDGSNVTQISFTPSGYENRFPDVRTRFDLYDYAG